MKIKRIKADKSEREIYKLIKSILTEEVLFTDLKKDEQNLIILEIIKRVAGR